ncbi:MAG: hypothetical protein KBS95_08210 [Alistipes sp.]|nr:hypothetical protein [Candidatus Alistipes equi]
MKRVIYNARLKKGLLFFMVGLLFVSCTLWEKETMEERRPPQIKGEIKWDEWEENVDERYH